MKAWRTTLQALLGAVLLALSLGVAGAVVQWRLSGVTFDDGTTAQGTFTYDDVAGTVTAWNIAVQRGTTTGLLPFAYMPGDSAVVMTSATSFFFDSVEGGAPHMNGVSNRQLRLASTAPFTAAGPLVPLDFTTPGGNGLVECLNCGSYRFIVAGALERVMLTPPVALVEVIEFYHAGFDHYFVSADPPEIAGLDTGFFTGWTRTGERFFAHAAGSYDAAPVRPVCRYYGLPSAGLDSHFYSADPAECFRVNRDFGAEWYAEHGNVFQLVLPDPASGACPVGMIPVYRLFNHRSDANHRYTTKPSIVTAMLALGWIREGYGPEATTMCAFPAPA